MVENRRISLLIKYSFDKLLSIFGLIIFSPIFFIVGLILRIQGEDIFYFQERVGSRGNKIFVYKFTTMPKGSEKYGIISTSNDSRPTPFGRFLRKTKINELPQLINVVKGEMSFVGPRPLVYSQIAEVLTDIEIVDYYKMRPGITGAGSLYYHHEDSLLSEIHDRSKYYREEIIPKKQQLEKIYAERCNLLLDVKILLLTLLVVVYGKIRIKEEFME